MLDGFGSNHRWHLQMQERPQPALIWACQMLRRAMNRTLKLLVSLPLVAVTVLIVIAFWTGQL
jgi:hypothetical protein